MNDTGAADVEKDAPGRRFEITGKRRAMKILPVGLLIEDRLCVVVGGGNVATPKAAKLLEAGAKVKVVAEEFTDDLAALEGIERVLGSYDKHHLEGAVVVIAATDDPETNAGVARDAKAIGALVNVVDTPELCEFIFPAVSRKGDVSVAISTGGASPALARRLKEEIDSSIDDAYGQLAAVLKEVRQRAIDGLPDAERRRAFFENLASDEFLEFMRENGPENAATEAAQRLEREMAACDGEG